MNLRLRILGLVFVSLVSYILLWILLESYKECEENCVIDYEKSEITSDKYLVYTPTCTVPHFEQWPPDLQEIYKPQPYRICSKDEDLVTSSFDRTKRRYMLHMNGVHRDISCCYWKIVRSGIGYNMVESNKTLTCDIFHVDLLVPLALDAIVVECKRKNSSELVQSSAFSFVQGKSKKPYIITVMPSLILNPLKLSVLMLGIDSLSRMNFRRTMPRTYKYLNENNWFEFEGYSSIDNSTFFNLMALLTGKDKNEIFNECHPNVDKNLDKCTFIWDQYQSHGYLTALAEDWKKFGAERFLKKNFKKQPTNYYFRSLTNAIESVLNVLNKSNENPYCLGRRHYVEYIYDYAMQFANFNEQRKPYYGFFWSSSFSQNDFNHFSSMDTKMLEYFRTLQELGILERTIVIFFSDHGLRYESIQKEFIEERMPVFYMSLPKWYQQTRKGVVATLKINKNRLTSPYDVHATLHHILEMGSYYNVKYSPPQSCPKCQSLFKVVPKNRTCLDAGIPEYWCSCSGSNNIFKNSE